MTPISPTEIRRTPDGLFIRWMNNEQGVLDKTTLRVNCPCAECKMRRGEDTHSAPLTPKKISLNVIQHSKEEETDLQEIWGVGKYALGIRWGDGHDTGIYPFDLLYSLTKNKLSKN